MCNTSDFTIGTLILKVFKMNDETFYEHFVARVKSSVARGFCARNPMLKDDQAVTL